MKPALGRMVHYRHPQLEGAPRAARITRVNDDGTVNLVIDRDIDDDPTARMWARNVSEGSEPGQWFEPPRVY